MNQLFSISDSQSKKICLSAWLIYCIITFLAVINHEPNRDEAQVWLIVRDFDLSSIFYQASSMGHPGLWYIILLPFAKLGFPYFTMLLIHWTIGITAAYLLLFRSQLDLILKILLVFSYYFIFEYMVPARNYSLTILLLFLIANNYEKRFTNPLRHALLVLLLFNANTHSFGAATALVFIYVLENYKQKSLKSVKGGIAIMILGFILFILQMLPSFDSVSHNITIQSHFIPDFNFNSFWVCITAVQNAFIPVTPEYEEIKIALFFVAVLGLFLLSFFRSPKILFFLLVSIGWLFYLFTTKLSGSWRHEGLILIFIVFSIWISENREKTFFITFLSCCLLITTIFGLKSIAKEIRYSYSGAKEVADFLKENKIDAIAAYPSWRATPIAPYLPQLKIWQIERNEYGAAYSLDSTFYRFGNSLDDHQVYELCAKNYQRECILVLDHALNENTIKSGDAFLIFNNKKFIWGSDDETYFIYSVNFQEH